MSWGLRKRNSIISIFFLIIMIIIGYYIFDALYEPPNCFDGKQNGEEEGVDCGGFCVLLCEHQVIEPIVHWSRFFEVSPGIYNVLAYIENPNPVGGVENVSYKFGIYDKENTLLQERTGEMKIPPKSIIPVIEPTLVIGKLEAERVSFDFTENLVWTRMEPNKSVIVIQDEELLDKDTEPKIVATLTNVDIVPIYDLKIIVIVYNKDDNAIASSSTILDKITGGNSAKVFFSWPNKFKNEVYRFEIIPLYGRETQ
jgi:hypothetical protein